MEDEDADERGGEDRIRNNVEKKKEKGQIMKWIKSNRKIER